MCRRSLLKLQQSGFTLVELIVSIVISAVIVGFMTMFLTTPVQAYLAQNRRAELDHQAQLAELHLKRDIGAALPNSVRYTQSGSRLAIEVWPVVDVAHYRDSGSLGAGNELHELDFTTSDNQFATYLPFTRITYPFVSTQHHLVINNLGQPGANAYELSNVITPSGTSIRIDNTSTGSFSPALPANEAHLTLGSGFQFVAPSAQHRLYLVDQPVTYLCDTAARTLTRYTRYSINPALSTATPGSAGVISSVISNDLAACAISCIPGTAQCSTAVTLNMIWSRDGESMNVMQQIALEHAR